MNRYRLSTGSNSDWVSEHPVLAFFVGVIITMMTVTGLWFLALYIVSLSSVENMLFEVMPGSGANINKTPISIGDIFGSSTNLTSVVIGTSVAVASAFVAMLVARTGMRAAEAALDESRLSNKFNSPDYLAMKSGIDKLGELSFLNDGLIYAYDAYKDLIVTDKSYNFKPDTVLLNRLSELLVSPHFSMTLNQAARLKADVENLEEEPVKEIHKRIAHLIVSVKALQQEEHLEAYQSKLLNALTLMRDAIEKVSWTKYTDEFHSGKVSESLIDAVSKYPVIGYLIADKVGLPSWSKVEYIAPIVQQVNAARSPLAIKERLTLALFPKEAGEIYAKAYSDKPYEINSVKYPATISSILSHGGAKSAIDGLIVRAAPGDSDALQSLIKKTTSEAYALGKQPLVIDLTNGEITQYSIPNLKKDIEEFKSGKYKLQLITVMGSEDHVGKWQEIGLKLDSVLGNVDQILILREFNDTRNKSGSETTGLFDALDENVENVFEQMREAKLNLAIDSYKTRTGQEADEALIVNLKHEIKRRDLISQYMRFGMSYTPGSLSLIAVVAEDFNKPVEFSESTIARVLDSSDGGNSNYCIVGDSAKIANVANLLDIDKDFIDYSLDYLATKDN